MRVTCPFCDGACTGANLEPLLDPRLDWLWRQIGRAADRRGDAALIKGSISVHVPDSAEERAAATGLLGGRTLKGGQTRQVDLGNLMLKARIRGTALTPGAVAAHALRRRLAVRAAANERRRSREHELLTVFLEGAQFVEHETFRRAEEIWAALRRNGWVSRLVKVGSERHIRSAVDVIAALPAGQSRRDRRQLAVEITGDPHALDHGTALGGFVLAVLVATGRVNSRQRPREAWASVGVECDDVVGGLIAVGILPVGWTLPVGALVTLPPRVLSTCIWPQPDAPDSFVFVTENPSIASASADLAANGHVVRLLCTSGTPATYEITAIGRLSGLGWRVAVRADFDAAGIGHVASILKAVPQALPWRMQTEDYLQSLQIERQEATLDQVPDAPWAPALASVMRERQVAAYEEALLPFLMEDLCRGVPG